MRKTLALFVALAAIPGIAAAACTGADPSVGAVSVGHVTTSGGLSTYRLTGTVTNVGTSAQASNVLQFVDISQSGEKLNSIGIPPLHPHQSYTYSYSAQRSSEAGTGTTKIVFRLRMKSPVGTGPQNCSVANDSYTLTF
jgi:hypothetical protein